MVDGIIIEGCRWCKLIFDEFETLINDLIACYKDDWTNFHIMQRHWCAGQYGDYLYYVRARSDKGRIIMRFAYVMQRFQQDLGRWEIVGNIRMRYPSHLVVSRWFKPRNRVSFCFYVPYIGTSSLNRVWL